MTAARFRVLVLAWLGCYLWWFALPHSTHKQPEYVQEAMQFTGAGAVFPTTDAIAFGFLTLMFVASVGLVVFERWARPLFVILTIVALILALLGGVSVTHPFDLVLGSILNMLQGGIIIAAYGSGIAVRFARREPEPEEAEEEGSPEPEQELVEVFRSGDESLIAIISTVFEANAIEFSAADEGVQDLFAAGRIGASAVGPVRFLVRKDDEARARELLAAEPLWSAAARPPLSEPE